jgi:hypothetical protein
MKKLLLAFAILGFVACGGNETETTPAADTTAVAVDTAAAIVDTAAAVNSIVARLVLRNLRG